MHKNVAYMGKYRHMKFIPQYGRRYVGRCFSALKSFMGAMPNHESIFFIFNIRSSTHIILWWNITNIIHPPYRNVHQVSPGTSPKCRLFCKFLYNLHTEENIFFSWASSSVFFLSSVNINKMILEMRSTSI